MILYGIQNNISNKKANFENTLIDVLVKIEAVLTNILKNEDKKNE